MKMDQIAFYCSSKTESDRLKQALGLKLDSWIEDIVTGKSVVIGKKEPQINIAHLQFNYQLGIEFEIIRYLSGPNWHAARNRKHGERFISHVGVHLEDEEDFPRPPGLLVQETWTQKHTSEYLTTGHGAGRKYHYRIYELAPMTWIKYIKRIHP